MWYGNIHISFKKKKITKSCINLTDSIERYFNNLKSLSFQPKKSGMGTKKGSGMGATKVKANFADIEQKANQADQVKTEMMIPEKKLTAAEEQEAMTSVRLAYQDLSLKKTKEEERLKTIDPTKAKQMERLGMGFNKRSAVSHSALSDMQTITQENAPKLSSKSSSFMSSSKEKEDLSDFYQVINQVMNDCLSDQYSTSSDKFEDAKSLGFDTLEPINDNQSKVKSMFSDSKSSSSSYGYSSSTDNKTTTSRSNAPSNNKSYENDEAQKKFANAKAISSEQFFGNNQSSSETSSNLSRFQGSNSISSADYFGDSSTTTNRHPHSRGLLIFVVGYR